MQGEDKFVKDIIRTHKEFKILEKDPVFASLPEQQKADVKFGRMMQVYRKNRGLKQKQLAPKIGVSVSTLKLIEKGKSTVQGKEKLISLISREIDWSRYTIDKLLGINSKPKSASQLGLEEAKEDFAHALIDSESYLEFFLAAFRIAQNFNVPFKKKTDREIDEALDEVLIMSSFDNLRRVKYSTFFLDLIYKSNKKKSQKRSAARQFFNSQMAKDFSKLDWKIILKRETDLAVLQEIYNILLELYEEDKIKLQI